MYVADNYDKLIAIPMIGSNSIKFSTQIACFHSRGLLTSQCLFSLSLSNQLVFGENMCPREAAWQSTCKITHPLGSFYHLQQRNKHRTFNPSQLSCFHLMFVEWSLHLELPEKMLGNSTNKQWFPKWWFTISTKNIGNKNNYSESNGCNWIKQMICLRYSKQTL